MRRDHRPYYIKKLCRKIEKGYVQHFLRPQFDRLGRGFTFMKPWHVEAFGPGIELGDYATVIAAPDRKVRLSVWPAFGESGFIRIGDYCLICPGVRIGAAAGITIGDNTMIASGAYITDADWHGLYDRTAIGPTETVTIGKNVWIGDRATVCKGVAIGDNSVIGTGAVVTRDIPPDTVVAGNPARVVKQLDPSQPFVTRSQWLADPSRLSREFDRMDREMLRENTFFHWLRHLFFPAGGD